MIHNLNSPVSKHKYSSRWGYLRVSGHTMAALGEEGCRVDGPMWKSMSEVMRRVFVVDAKPSYCTDDIIYLCVSPFFDELEEGEDPPEYEAWLKNDRDEVSGEEVVVFLRFERLKGVVRRNNLRW